MIGKLAKILRGPYSGQYRQDLMNANHGELLRARHDVRDPSRLVRPFVDQYYHQRRSTKIEDHSFLRAKYDGALKGSRVYFLPGFLNYPLDPTMKATFGHLAEFRMAHIGTSGKQHYIQKNYYTIVGGKNPAYTPDWRDELPTVLLRIYVDMMEQRLRGNDIERPILIGHSKGGLLANAISAFAQGRKITGLEKISPYIVESLRLYFQNASYVAIGSPFEGLETRTETFARSLHFDRLFHGASRYFSEEFLDRHYENIGSHPADSMDLVLTSDPHLENDVDFVTLIKDLSRFKGVGADNLFLYGGDLLFDLGALLLIEGSGDALTTEYAKEYKNAHHLKGFNHMSQISKEAAEDVARLLLEHIA